MSPPVALLEGWSLADAELLARGFALNWAAESAKLAPLDDLILTTVTGFNGVLIQGISKRGRFFVADITTGFELRPICVDTTPTRP